MNMKCTDEYHKTRVTISIPREAGDSLKYLAKFNAQLLERLGILAIRVDGSETVNVCSNPSESISRGRPSVPSTSSSGKHTNMEIAVTVPPRSGFKRQVSESFVGSSKQSCNISAVPYERGFDKTLKGPQVPNVRFSSCQDPEPVRWAGHPSSSVFQSHCFNQLCSVNNVSSGPYPLFSPITTHRRSNFDFEQPVPGWHLTDRQENMDSSTFKSTGLFHVFSSSNNIPTTSHLQSTSSIGGIALETPCSKVRKTRQRKKAQRNSVSRNCSVTVDSSLHQMTATNFISQPSVTEKVCNIVRSPCKRYSSEDTYINNSTNVTEILSESELIAKRCLSHFSHQEPKLDGSVAIELSNLQLSSSLAINSEHAAVAALMSNIKLSGGGSKEVTNSILESSLYTSENIQQTVASRSSTSFHLDEKSGLLITLSPRLQMSFASGDGVSTMPKSENMVSKHIAAEVKDETDRQSEQDAANAGKFSQLSMETFTTEGQDHVLDEKCKETCLDLLRDRSEKTIISEVNPDVPTSNDKSSNEITESVKENLANLDLADFNATNEIEMCYDSGELTHDDPTGLSSPKKSKDTFADCCVGASVDKFVGTGTVDEESPNLETKISVIVAEDICELIDSQSAGNISPDSAVVGDATSVETIEENETSSVSLLAESSPLNGRLDSLIGVHTVSDIHLVTGNQNECITDANDSVKDFQESNSSSEANICCKAVVEFDEMDESNAAKFTPANDNVNSINSESDVSDPVELTWSGLANKDIEVIKLNNKHSALDLAVTRFEDVSRCSKGTLSEDLRRLNALVVCEFDSVVVNSSSLFCVAKVTEEANSKVPRDSVKCETRKLPGSLKQSKRHLSLYSLLTKRRMKRKIFGNFPVLNKEPSHLNRCALDASRRVSLAKKFRVAVTKDL